MDISSDLLERNYAGEPMVIPLAKGPFSIWPRLAVCPTVQGGPGVSTAQKRVIRDFEFVMLVRGRGWVWWEPYGASIDLTPGDVVFFPPGVVHGWAVEENTHLALHFDIHARPAIKDMDMIRKMPQWVKRAPTNQIPCFKINLAGDELMIPLVTQVRAPEEWRQRLMPLVERYHAKTLQTGMGRLLAAEAVGWGLRTLAQDAGPLLNQPGPDARIARALALADAKWNVSVAQLAKAAGMGQTAFRQAFTRNVGRTPREYIEDRRLAHAKHLLLETSQAIFEVAQACGYSDPYHFSRVFARVTGESPRGYRKARLM